MPDSTLHKNDGQPAPVGGTPSTLEKTIEKKWKEAKRRHEIWQPQWEEAFRYTMPNRLNFDVEEDMDIVTGEIFDETAVVETPRFASRLVNGMFPPNLDAFRIRPGPDHPRPDAAGLQQNLDALAASLHNSLRTSSFHSELEESNLDLAIGTGHLLMEAGPYPGMFDFRSIPITNIALLNGSDERPGCWFRWRKRTLDDIENLWPDANISEQLKKRLADGKQAVIVESYLKEYRRDGVETGTYVVFEDGYEKELIVTREYGGLGSTPFISYRWSTSPGEPYGRGPLLNVMPAVLTCNQTVELTLQNAQIAIGGVWTYDHDGVFNPDNIILEPGVFIPKARGSEVSSLVNNSRFDVSNLILDEMRRNIKAGLFAPISDRPQGRTPPSATEIADDNARMAEAMGAVTGRLATELVYRIVQRGVYIYKLQGLFGRGPVPRIDGRQYELHFTSPLLRAQSHHDINNFSRFLGQSQSLIGPQIPIGAMMPLHKNIAYLARLHNVPSDQVPTMAQVQAFLQKIMQATQQQQQLEQQQQQG